MRTSSLPKEVRAIATADIGLASPGISGLRRFARSGLLQAVLLVGLYLASELSRGLARGGVAVADRHADDVVRIERRLHVFDEATIQRAVHHVYGLPALLGYAYLTLHLTVTVAVLFWAYRNRRSSYRIFRDWLAVASGLAVAGYALFPTAPPRLAGVGVGDTVSGATSINLGSSLVSSLYNPYAAMPSMHIGFSLLVAAVVWKVARRPLWRAAGLLYPLLILFVIVATGNHFFLDAAAGAGVAVLAVLLVAVTATLQRRAGGEVRVAALPISCTPYPGAGTSKAA